MPGELGVVQEVLVPIPLGCGIRCFPGLRMGLSPCNPAGLSRDPAPPKTLGLPLAPCLGERREPCPSPAALGFLLEGNVWVCFLSRCWSCSGPGCLGVLRRRPLPFPPHPVPRCRGEQAVMPAAQPFAAASPRCRQEQGTGAPRARPSWLGCPLHICG